jgi:hypothetical protein
MSHLLILCEGDLEQRVLEAFFIAYWQSRFRTVEVQKYAGNGDLKINYKADTQTQLKTEPASSVLCLVDLYQEPFGVYTSSMNVQQGFLAVQQWLYNAIPQHYHARFGGFPVVMETETWLLADPQIQQKLGQSFPDPENVYHPAGELEKIYRAKKQQYDKIIDGVTLFRQASAKRIYDDNCPHFKQLLDWLTTPPSILPSPQSSAVQQWEQELEQKYQHWQALERAAAIQAEKEYVEYALRKPH